MIQITPDQRSILLNVQQFHNPFRGNADPQEVYRMEDNGQDGYIWSEEVNGIRMYYLTKKGEAALWRLSYP